MDYPESIFTIIEDNDCPLYEKNDQFKVTKNILLTPEQKSTCLILTNDIQAAIGSLKNEDGENVIKCSGCTGSISLKYVPADKLVELDADGIKDEDIEDIVKLLSGFTFFKAFGEKNIRSLVPYLKPRKFAEDEVIMHHGDIGQYLYLILSGSVDVLVGKEQSRIASLGRGETFGEMSLLSGNPVGATIMTTEPTSVLYLSAKVLNNFLLKYPSLLLYFIRLLIHRLSKTNLMKVEEFVAGMVGKLSEMPPVDLLQFFYINQKTGVLNMRLPNGEANLFFKEGGLVKAIYNDKSGKDAVFEILREKKGTFKFNPISPEKIEEEEEIGDFLWLLMEGLRRIDEDTNLLNVSW